jgi:hypothetical protein
VKDLLAFIFFLDKNCQSLRKSCRGKISLDDRGFFTGELVNFADADDSIVITEGELTPGSNIVRLYFSSGGQMYKAGMTQNEAQVKWGVVNLGMVGTYALAETKQIEGILVASFSLSPG